MELTSSHCVPCEGGTKPLDEISITHMLGKLQETWEVIDGQKIRHRFQFDSFKQAIAFTNSVADLATQEGHHPVITINYKKVTITLWTHAIGGLSTNDFILAAKIEQVQVG